MRVVIVLPTYDEAENIADFLEAVRQAVPEVDVLVVDEGSPDGTGALAEVAAAELGQIKVLHRPGKLGLGSAYLAGFRFGLERGAELLLTMDCDGSHDPRYLPAILAASRRADLQQRQFLTFDFQLAIEAIEHGGGLGQVAFDLQFVDEVFLFAPGMCEILMPGSPLVPLPLEVFDRDE